ncbi:MAG: hypothetical protein JWM11_7709, partial [Planctomycetaceae bacterium]|nr:hypothetical protein [Planctomycetaceae bacterium]
MSKQRVDQLYCTHCTYRTSALHRREGAAGEQVFDESARAASVPREKSHEVFRRFSANLLFHVPGDMPSTEMVQHTAHTLPFRRLVYSPSTGGYRLLAHVCFRQTDVTGRPGASFSHVLIQELKDFPAPWSAVDCLRLWGSENWVIEDAPHLPHDLPPINDLSEFDSGGKSLINDEMLFRFLTTPAGTGFRGCEAIITRRWQQAVPEARQKLLVYVLQAVLNLDFERRESLFLVVEPPVAALLFYGIYRLLPSVGIAERLSFSTYQSHRDRLTTTLAATCFHDPDTTDLPDELYSPQTRGAAFNTFKSDRYTPLKRSGRFASDIVDRFITQGPQAVDSFLGTCGRVGVGNVEQLEGLAAIDGLAAELLTPQNKEQLALLERRLPRETGLRSILRETLSQSVDLDPESSLWSRILVRPAQGLLILKLLTETGTAGQTRILEPMIQQIVARWPEASSADLLNDKDVLKTLKVDFTGRFIETNGRLPGNAESLFFSAGSVARREKVLEGALCRIQGMQLEEFLFQTFRATPTEVCFTELLRSLAPPTKNRHHDQAFEQLFHHVAVEIPRSEKQRQLLNTALGEKAIRDRVRAWPDDDVLSAHLLDVLNTLEKLPSQLEQKLDLLDELKNFIPVCKPRITAWRKVAQQLHELRRLNSETPSLLHRILGQNREHEQEQAGKELSFAAKKALPSPPPALADPRPDIVIRMVVDAIGGKRLPKQFITSISDVFEKDVWTYRSPRHYRHIGLGILLILASIVAIRGLILWQSPANSQIVAKTEALESSKPAPAALPDTAPPSIKADEADEAGKTAKSTTAPLPLDKVAAEKKPVAPAKIAKVTTKKIASAEDIAEVKMVEGTPDTGPSPESASDWPSFCELPPLGQSSEKHTAPLHAWKKRENIQISLIGSSEINAFLARSPDPKMKDSRIYVAARQKGETDKIPSLRMFKVTSDDLETRKVDPTRSSPNHQDCLCWFDVRNEGLFFGWENLDQPQRERKLLQEMLRLCCLHIESDKHRGDINLLAPQRVFTQQRPSSLYTYDKNSKLHGTTFEFETHLKGIEAFHWLVVRGQIDERNSTIKPTHQFVLNA